MNINIFNYTVVYLLSPHVSICFSHDTMKRCKHKDVLCFTVDSLVSLLFLSHSSTLLAQWWDLGKKMFIDHSVESLVSSQSLSLVTQQIHVLKDVDMKLFLIILYNFSCCRQKDDIDYTVKSLVSSCLNLPFS